MYDRIKFFRRRQFVLGPEYINYEGWNRLKITDRYLLTVHPDLPVTVVENNSNKAVLLGYAIDPFNPEHQEEDILKSFIGKQLSISVLTAELEKLSGRFILIIKCPAGFWLFHDACALRKVNYCKDKDGSIWCATQSETIAEHLGYKYDDEVLSYRKLPNLDIEEFWIINDRSPFREILCLLANHYLDLYQGKAYRFWPDTGCLKPLSRDENLHLRTTILRNNIKIAAERFDLRMGISAGGDSRRTLAAARDVTEKIFMFTHTPRPHSTADFIIPARLLSKLGINHHQFNLQTMDPEFRQLYERSSTWARERRGHIACTLLKEFGPETTVLNSNLSEIHEIYYWLPKSKITGEGLAMITSLSHPFAIKELQKWLDGARPACEKAGLNILSLFDMEVRSSRWVATAFCEYDIAHETFSPYNNRLFLALELSTSERLRQRRNRSFIIQHIKHMWPEVLIEPINPQNNILKNMEQYVLQNIIHKFISPIFPVYDYLVYLKHKKIHNKIFRNFNSINLSLALSYLTLNHHDFHQIIDKPFF